MIVTVHPDRQPRVVVAGFVGENAQERATAFLLSSEDPDALVTRSSGGQRVSVQTRDLQPGDVLIPTQACVLRSYAGAHTPRGKIDVCLRHPNGRQRKSPWGRYTRLTVVRHTAHPIKED